MNPASWSSADVQDWARRKGLPDSTATALAENEVDGPTLLTLDREELRAGNYKADPTPTLSLFDTECSFPPTFKTWASHRSRRGAFFTN